MAVQRIRDIFIRLVFLLAAPATESEANERKEGRTGADRANARKEKSKRDKVGRRCVRFSFGRFSLASRFRQIAKQEYFNRYCKFIYIPIIYLAQSCS